MASPSGGPADPADLAASVGAATRGPSLPRAATVMSVGTALSRLSGFARVAVIAWAIGGVESKLPDTYQLANTLPNIVYQLILGEVLQTVFVPVFVEHLARRSREESWRLASTMVNLSFLAAGAFSALTVMLAPWLIKIYSFRVHGTDRAAQEQVGAFFLRLLMPQMAFYAVGAVLTGLLIAHRRFAAPMFAPILNNVIVIATFVAFRASYGARTPQLASLTTGDKLLLGLGTTAGVVAMTLALLPAVRRLPRGYRIRELDWRHPAVRKVGRLARYSLGYVAVNQVGIWVVKALANGIPGGVAAYDTSFILYQLPYGIVAVSVMTALVPRLSEHHVLGDRPAFRRDLSIGLRSTAFVVAPASAGFIALARPLVRLLFQHGAFSAASTDLFADTLSLMAIGLTAYAAFQQITRAFYSMQDTRTPWLVNIVATALGIVAALPLYAVLGVPGLGLAHAISYVSAAGIGIAVLHRRLGGIEGHRLAVSHIRVALASVATGAGAWAAARLVSGHTGTESFAGQALQIGAGIGAGLILFGVVASALHAEEMRPLLRIVTRRPSSSGPRA